MYKLGSGRLVAQLLRGRGVVRLDFPEFPVPFDRWKAEAVLFAKDRSLANERLVKFTENEEDLSRTLAGAGTAQHRGEKRSIFDVKDRIRVAAPEPRFEFFRAQYEALHNIVVPAVREELSALAPWVTKSALGNCILRHNIYPKDGGCGVHTDYGLCTVQLGTHGELEVEVDGQWKKEPPGWLLYAGDMLEILTDGDVPAVKHRVSSDSGQSHVFFVQPSDEDEVAPAPGFAGKGREKVVYKDWHSMKKKRAFGLK